MIIVGQSGLTPEACFVWAAEPNAYRFALFVYRLLS